MLDETACPELLALRLALSSALSQMACVQVLFPSEAVWILKSHCRFWSVFSILVAFRQVGKLDWPLMSPHFLCAWSASSTNKQTFFLRFESKIWDHCLEMDLGMDDILGSFCLRIGDILVSLCLGIDSILGLLCLGIDDIWGSLCLGNNALPGNWWLFISLCPGTDDILGSFCLGTDILESLPGNWQHLGITLPENWHLGITLPGNWWHSVDVYDRLTRGSYLWKGTGKQVTCVHVANIQLKWSVHHLTLTLVSLGQTMELSRHPHLESTGIIFWTNPVHAQYALYSKSEHEWITQEWLCN